jgi:type IX secretion system PorP/SprF family membrane protein
MKRILTFALAFGTMISVSKAQDFHYSQFFFSPITTNPGNTGVFNGDIRAYTMYRMQWFTVATPYKTFSIAVDGPVFKNKMKGPDFFAVGVNFNNDNQGDVRLKTNSYNVLASYTKFLGGRQRHNVTLGYEIGYATRSVTTATLKWDSQYDPNTGSYNPAFGSGEPGGGAIGYIDMSTGMVWNFTTDHLFRSALGFSVHHFTGPNQSIRGGYDRLKTKYSFQANINYKLHETSNTTLEPSILVAQQGTSLLLTGGVNVKYVLEERSRYTSHQSDKAFRIGAFYRFRDAFFLTLRFDYMDFSGALAYDVNVSGLTPASKTVGGFELMLMYKGVFGKNKNAKRSSARFM